MQINQSQMKNVDFQTILDEDANKFATAVGRNLCEVANNVKLTKDQFIGSLNLLTTKLCNQPRS